MSHSDIQTCSVFPSVDLLDESEAVLFALAQAVEQRDSITGGHCERLAITSLAMGMAMCLDHTSLAVLYRASYLHDVGKVGIPDAILFKPARLTAEEWVLMRSHPARGVEICRHLQQLAPVLPLIRHHHERWNGTGYPDGLRGTQIPLLARVLQVADIYDALTNARPYKPAYSSKQAVQIIEEETSRGWRDPEIVSIFLNIHSTVIVRIAEFDAAHTCSFDPMSSSLNNLSRILERDPALSVVDTPSAR
jgi:putative two-component system response regulator